MRERGRTHGVYHPRVEADSFFALIPEAFGYPLRGTAKYIILLGAVFFLFLDAMAMVPLYGILAAILAAGYMASFLFEVVGYSAGGRRDLPDWPAVSSIYEDIIVPAFCMIGTLAVCVLPGAVLWIWTLMTDRQLGVAALVTLIVGLACYPMALLGVALNRTFEALNPLVIAAAIVQVPLEYATVCVLFVGLAALGVVAPVPLLGAVPLVGLLGQQILSLYLAVVQMRLLGLLYYTKADALGWFAVE
jgi:hypothetical protein